MRLRSAFRSVARASQRFFGDEGAITLTRIGSAPTPTQAVVYSEQVEWRRGNRNERTEVRTREVHLAPGVDPVGVGSTFTVGAYNYTVVRLGDAKASTAIVLYGERHGGVSNSRSDGWS
ncbi:hypothetical protein K227x_64290 [Rubripirellula lacrimiformis]|uniref:Phage head-tail joining protein n=1 Tax=Rubripirellula lacrimiformis TaxID=1930273 RepID=A0A517NLN9_9BACT|nr:hypothetical protein [Rubripirellula lacrimiformis]QDT07999.1 hypothetical protein K227x_64290 [Rubripirellula lacrimiformis]